MILIPNYCPAYSEQLETDCSFIFDYLGIPYGFDTTCGPSLVTGFIDPWSIFIKNRYNFTVYPHSRM